MMYKVMMTKRTMWGEYRTESWIVEGERLNAFILNRMERGAKNVWYLPWPEKEEEAMKKVEIELTGIDKDVLHIWMVINNNRHQYDLVGKELKMMDIVERFAFFKKEGKDGDMGTASRLTENDVANAHNNSLIDDNEYKWWSCYLRARDALEDYLYHVFFDEYECTYRDELLEIAVCRDGEMESLRTICNDHHYRSVENLNIKELLKAWQYAEENN